LIAVTAADELELADRTLLSVAAASVKVSPRDVTIRAEVALRGQIPGRIAFLLPERNP
jgi:hypothetical protein